MPPPPLLALRIEVPSWRAARAVPAFVELLRRHRAGASFLFAWGPDHSGRALNHIFQPEQHGRAHGSSLSAHFGFDSLFYGTLLPAPNIARRSMEILRQLRDEGFEIGVHGWDSLAWVNRIEHADADWSTRQCELACAAFKQALDIEPRLHAAPGWRSNPHALRLTQRFGFSHASDTRGRHPFVPVWNGEVVRCPQIPTTLPTLDELLATADPAMLSEQLFALTATPPPQGHVFSLRLDPLLTTSPALIETLFTRWREQGYELTSIRNLAGRLNVDKLPRHEIVVGKVPGRCGTLLLQGEAFLSSWRRPA